MPSVAFNKNHKDFIILSYFWINQFVNACNVGFAALFLFLFSIFGILPRID